MTLEKKNADSLGRIFAEGFTIINKDATYYNMMTGLTQHQGFFNTNGTLSVGQKAKVRIYIKNDKPDGTYTGSSAIEYVTKDGKKAIGPTVSYTITLTGGATTNVCTACKADIDKSGKVDISDYSYLVSCYNKKSTDKNSSGKPCTPSDINGDGKVTGTDFSCLTSQFNKKC